MTLDGILTRWNSVATVVDIRYDTIRYDTIVEFNVDSKLSIQLNIAHVARN